MSDPRLTPANGRVAHESLRGEVKAGRFVEGDWAQVNRSRVPLMGAPDGPRERELLFGAAFLVLENRDGLSFGRAENGYVGYVQSDGLVSPPRQPTHFVSAVRTYAKEIPDLKAKSTIHDLSFLSLVSVARTDGAWSEVSFRTNLNPDKGLAYFVPTTHLRPISEPFTDLVAVAELFLGTPYLWGGNSAFGIDCSGLVQAALEACHIACPGDSDQQEALLGTELAPDAPLQRGDLIFWKGHVALVVDDKRLIHANASAMAVAYEGIEQTIKRVSAQGEGPVTSRKRIILRP